VLKRHLIAIFLLSILGLLIYSNSFHCSFHFDDHRCIVENLAIHRFDLKAILKSPRPVLDFTFALNYVLGELNVFGYHLVNVTLHILNAILIYFILFYTLKWPVNQFYQKKSWEIPFYTALLFIAHPIQTQAVTYISCRSSVLATFFYLLALFLFIKSFFSKRKNLYIVGTFLASCLGMGTKAIATTLPAMLLLYDYYFIADKNIKKMLPRLKIHALFFLTISISIYTKLSYLKEHTCLTPGKVVMLYDKTTLNSYQYFLTQLHVIFYYIKLLFLPINLNLDYDFPITRTLDFCTFACFLGLTFLIALAIRISNKYRLLSFAILWFFITLSVTSSFFVIVDVIFEHRLYLPSFGFCLFLSLAIIKVSHLLTEFLKNKLQTQG